MNLQTPPQALRKPPRRSCGAPEHLKELSKKTRNTELRAPEDLEELSSSLQGPKPELPNISKSCQAASKERISSEQNKKKVSNTKENNQATKRAIKQSSKRAHEQTSKRANEHMINRTNKQSNEQEVGGVPRRACNNNHNDIQLQRWASLIDQ